MTEPRNVIDELLDVCWEVANDPGGAMFNGGDKRTRAAIEAVLRPPGPRSWSLPPEPPEDVRRLNGVDRLGEPVTLGRHIDLRWFVEGETLTELLTWRDAFCAYAPLTEVVDSDG